LGHVTLRNGKEAIVSFEKTQQQDVKLQIRWLIRRDMAEVLKIENASFEYTWSEEDFLRCLRQRNCIGMVAEQDHEIVGFMIYELHKSKLRILNFAVASEARRRGVGRQMICRLIDKLSQQRRKEIVLDIRETNLQAQIFFRNEGFRAVRILRDYYDDTDEDAYVMRYRLAGSDELRAPYIIKNRISEYDESELEDV
jgi:ribosomal-protein-alanine N-acetyltransferase